MAASGGREQYIIPPYQRPYSWGVDQCQQLYDDIVAAYNDNSDYFLGNIVLAVSEKKIRSDVLESNDDKTLKEIYLWDFQNNNTPLKEVISSCLAEDSFHGKDHHKTNFLFFLQRFVDFKEAYGQENLTKFLKFTLRKMH